MNGNAWMPREVERLRRLYPDYPDVEVARRTGHPAGSVAYKAHQLRLRKSEAYLAAHPRARMGGWRQRPDVPSEVTQRRRYLAALKKMHQRRRPRRPAIPRWDRDRESYPEFVIRLREAQRPQVTR